MSDPETTSTQTDSHILGFSANLQFSTLAINLYNNLTSMHRLGYNQEARELFKNNLADFQGLFDVEFITECIKIEEMIDSDDTITDMQKEEKIYRLQRGQFARLLVRAGVVQKPDIRLDFNVDWEVPKEIIGMGKKKSAEVLTDAE